MDNNFLAISIRGVSHIKGNKPMQDYSLAYKNDDYCIAVVCDGHGADKHFRSETGSKFAAEIALDKLKEFANSFSNWKDVEKEKDRILHRLKLGIISLWHKKIANYTNENEFTEEELKKASNSFLQKKAYNVAQPYGTTLLAALIRSDYYLLLMLGDGAIIKILPDFSSEIVQFEGKKSYDDGPHSATDSLCEINAYEKMFAICSRIDETEQGVAFALMSDGLSEAFDTDAILLKKINNYLNYYAEEGLEKAAQAIEKQLNELSRISAMKDDISLSFATNSLEFYDKRVLDKNTDVESIETKDSKVETDDCSNASNKNETQEIGKNVEESTVENTEGDSILKTNKKEESDG